MIGGMDIHLQTRAGDEAVQVAVRAIRDHWPHAVYENGDTGDLYEQFSQIPFAELDEIFVYRDMDAAKAWDEEGAVPALYNTMIHVLGDEDMITLVVDEKDGAMQEMIATVKSALDDETLYLPALLEAA